MVKEIKFFLIELHAYKTGDSLPAPKFEIIEKPNDFIKDTKWIKSDIEMNRSQAERLNLWKKFKDVIIKKGMPFNTRKASIDHWYDVSIGTSESNTSITLVNKDGYIGVGLYIIGNKELFDELFTK